MSDEERDGLRARLVEMYERIIPEEIAKGVAASEAKLAEAQELALEWCADKTVLKAELERLRSVLEALLEREEVDLKHAYTTCDVGDSTNAERGCIWCVARAALAPEVK